MIDGEDGPGSVGHLCPNIVVESLMSSAGRSWRLPGQAVVRAMASSGGPRPPYTTLAVSQPQQFVTHVELRRPEKLNAMNRDFWRQGSPPPVFLGRGRRGLFGRCCTLNLWTAFPSGRWWRSSASSLGTPTAEWWCFLGQERCSQQVGQVGGRGAGEAPSDPPSRVLQVST